MDKGSVKVEDGKMVKISLEVNEDVVDGVELRGDFFLEPPEKLEELERSIRGLDVESSVDEVVKSLEDVDADLIGFSREDVGKAFRKALKGVN